MATSGMKFIRVHGRVVPIKATQGQDIRRGDTSNKGQMQRRPLKIAPKVKSVPGKHKFTPALNLFAQGFVHGAKEGAKSGAIMGAVGTGLSQFKRKKFSVGNLAFGTFTGAAEGAFLHGIHGGIMNVIQTRSRGIKNWNHR